MRIIFLISFLFTSFLSAFGQHDNGLLLKGFILNAEHLQVVPLANIGVQGNKERAVSNRNGFFKIYVHQSDTLNITAVGFAPLSIPVSSFILKNMIDTIVIFLTSVSYPLRGVDVIRSSARRDSIARIVAGILEHDSLMNNYDRIYKRPKGKIYVGTGIIYEGLIQDLYNKFSKEGKDDVRFEAFVKYALKQNEVDEKYNKDMVKKATNIDDGDLDEFMLFCNPDRDFIISSAEYDLILAVRKCFDEFNAQRLRNRNKLK